MTLAATLEVIDTAMIAVVTELSLEFTIDPSDDATAAMLQALRQPVCLAAVLDDVYKALGMTAPALVQLAIEGEAPGVPGHAPYARAWRPSRKGLNATVNIRSDTPARRRLGG